MAPWKNFGSGIEEKLVCIYSWMPRTIMNLNGERNRPRADLYSPEVLTQTMRLIQGEFEKICGHQLLHGDLDEIADSVTKLWTGLEPPLGATAASKYLHFSAPNLFGLAVHMLLKVYF